MTSSQPLIGQARAFPSASHLGSMKDELHGELAGYFRATAEVGPSNYCNMHRPFRRFFVFLFYRVSTVKRQLKRSEEETVTRPTPTVANNDRAASMNAIRSVNWSVRLVQGAN